jgi:hypothetical protein
MCPLMEGLVIQMKKLIPVLAVLVIALAVSESYAHGPSQFRGRSSFRSNSFRGPSFSLNFGSRNFRRDDEAEAFRAGFRAAQQQQFRQFQFRGHN